MFFFFSTWLSFALGFHVLLCQFLFEDPDNELLGLSCSLLSFSYMFALAFWIHGSISMFEPRRHHVYFLLIGARLVFGLFP